MLARRPLRNLLCLSRYGPQNNVEKQIGKAISGLGCVKLSSRRWIRAARTASFPMKCFTMISRENHQNFIRVRQHLALEHILKRG